MNGPNAMDTFALYLEIGQNSIHVAQGDTGLELPLERLENGRLTEACRERLITSLTAFLKRPGRDFLRPALCAIGARGVLFRRLTIPQSSKDDLSRLLGLQIESEFPLPPDQLAWGYRRLERGEQPANLAPGLQAFLVAAVKKEVVEEYSELLARCGVSATFTLAALARGCLRPPSDDAYAALDIGRWQSELILFEGGVPVAIRILPWGGENVTAAIQERMGVSRDEAEKLKLLSDREHSSDSAIGSPVELATIRAVEVLAKAIQANGVPSRLCLTGKPLRQKSIATQLVKDLGSGVKTEQVAAGSAPGDSPAIQGLKKSGGLNGRSELVILRFRADHAEAALSQPGLRRLAAVAGVLLLACLAFPYLESMLLKSRLAKKLAEVEASRGRLASIDREFNFLRYLKQNQAPYIDAMYLMANAAPQGARFESLSMNRRGEVSLRGNMKDSQQLGQFRSKLIDSGFFSSVVVEEQTPTPDRQKLVVRMTAQWKPAAAREKLKFGPTPEELEKIKATAKELGPGGAQMPMGGAFPMAPGAFPPAGSMPVPPPGVRSGVPSRSGGSPAPPRTTRMLISPQERNN